MKRNIAVITGTRAEYGLLNPVMKAIANHSKLSISVIATGMHLSHEHGYTIDQIRKDGFRIDAAVDMLLSNDTGAAMAKSLGIGIIGITQALEHIKPDIILVLGDRGETLAAAIASSHMNIPLAHIHGGDTMTGGVIDNNIRHAITKLAHIHFPATRDSTNRILNLGEESWRVHLVGAPALDRILNADITSKAEMTHKYHLQKGKPLIMVVQHPVNTEFDQAGKQMLATLNVIVKLKRQTIIIYPNADAGGTP